MANKDSKTTAMNNKETIKKISAKVHEELLNTSHMFIDETVATLTRMQKITGKVIKKSEPLLEKQIEMTFDAVEAIANQTEKGGKRALKLFGLTKQYNKLTNTISKKVNEIPSTEEMIESAKEMVANAKSDVEDTINKASDSLKTAVKIGEKEIKENTAKIEKKVAKSKVAKKVVNKVKKSTTATKKTVTPKKAVVAKVKVASKATATKAKVSELTQINGIGPSLAAIMTDNGIKTLNELANATPTALKVIATKAGNR
ncbi:MAG: helix-hairpin-helix domain-containing protein, partial [Saprospiraceae bacterium]|nr:helix-hairpin-helix domain-containing protein [Saprospiraceae bacterium]